MIGPERIWNLFVFEYLRYSSYFHEAWIIERGFVNNFSCDYFETYLRISYLKIPTEARLRLLTMYLSNLEYQKAKRSPINNHPLHADEEGQEANIGINMDKMV